MIREVRLNYAALGDSSGVGVGSESGYPELVARRLVQEGFRVGLLNVAQSGATASVVRARQIETVLRKKPDLITVGVGTNDLWRLVPIERFAADLSAIGDQLQSSGARVIVSNIADLSTAPIGKLVGTFLNISRDAFQARLDALNDVIAKLASRPRFVLADLHSVSRSELAAHPEYFCEDGFHPSARGYERWTEIIWPHVHDSAQSWARDKGAVSL